MVVGHFSISDAFAYIDPSSGTLIIQMLAGAFQPSNIDFTEIPGRNQ